MRRSRSTPEDLTWHARSAANLAELESLRIARRPSEEPQALPILLVGLIVVVALAGAGYAHLSGNTRTSSCVETVMVTFRRTDQPGVLLTDRGTCNAPQVHHHRYQDLGTDRRRARSKKASTSNGEICWRESTTGLSSAVTASPSPIGNLRKPISNWLRAKAAREHELYASGIISKDELELTVDRGSRWGPPSP